MKSSIKLIVTVLLLSVFLSSAATCLAQTSDVDSARASVRDAYTILLEVHDAGGDVVGLTEQLNFAFDLLAQAEDLLTVNPAEAQRLSLEAQTVADEVMAQAPSIKEEGIAQGQLSVVLIGGLAAILVVVGVLVYLFGPKFMWRIWLRLRKNYRVGVKSSTEKKNTLIITGKSVSALILIALLAIAFFAVAQAYFPQSGESFSELGILGPDMNLGDYPSVVVAGESINLYGYVGNHMGKPMDYVLMIKLGDNETAVNPAPVAVFNQYEQIVPHNGTWIFPINLTLTQPGLNQRLIFELWIYNETLSQTQYHDRWGQLWLNVTSPAA